MEKGKGFTLIELLAVIVILAVIALISIPIVLNVIENAQKRADMSSANGLIDAGRLYYSESFLDDNKKDNVDNYRNLWKEIVIKGEKPQNGYLYVNPKGEIAVSVIYRNRCYQKRFETGLEVLKESDCGLGFVGIDKTAPEVTFTVIGSPFNESNWAKEDFYIGIEVVDAESGPATYKWCTTVNERCNPETEYSSEIGATLISEEASTNRVCVIGIDQGGNKSEIICSDSYKLDKTSPTFEVMLDITINLKDVLELERGVKPIDSLSGVEGTFEYHPKEVDRTKTSTTDITYTVEDQAGNVGVYVRKVKTVADAPSVGFNHPENVLNEYGWAKEDFYIKIVPVDYSGHGIKEIKWCSTTNTECEPVSTPKTRGVEVSVLITVESNQNRVCMIGIDNDDNQSKIICSESYQLDKTPPSINGIGDITTRKDQRVDLVSGVTAVDSLSGINGSYIYSPTSVDTSRSGITNITYSVEDKAGNKQEYIRKVIVETEAPTVTFTVEPGKMNENGWSKQDFFVTFTANDQSGHGMRDYKWCSTTNASCDPSGNVAQSGNIGSSVINLESASNRICVIATDNSGKSSTSICSDGYRLDKTVPVAGSFNINGIPGANGWYVSDVGLSANDGSDSLSGHAWTSIDRNVINYDTWGQVVTITTSDNAGNTSTRQQNLLVDRNSANIYAKVGSSAITVGDSYDILSSYFAYGNVGLSSIVSTSCYAGGTPIFNTSGLAVGNYTLTCYVTKQNGNTSSASMNLTVENVKYLYYTQYYSEYNSGGYMDLYRCNLAGTNCGKIASLPGYSNGFGSSVNPMVTATPTNLYYTQSYSEYNSGVYMDLYRCNTDGTNCGKIISLLPYTHYFGNGVSPTIATTTTNLYYTSFNNDAGGMELYRCNPDGTNCGKITTLLPYNNSYGSSIDPMISATTTNLYYTQYNYSTGYVELYRCNPDGTNCGKIASLNGYADGYGGSIDPVISATMTDLYYTHYNAGKMDLYHCNPDGTNCGTIASLEAYTNINPAVSATMTDLYYTHYNAGKMDLYRCNLDGTNCGTIASLPYGPKLSPIVSNTK